MNNTTATQSLRSFDTTRAALYVMLAITAYVAMALLGAGFQPGGFVAAITVGLATEVGVSAQQRRRTARHLA